MNLLSNTYFPGNVVSTRQFLYVYARAGEYILLGSRNRSANGTGSIYVYSPQSFGAKGNETAPATAAFTCNGNGSGGNSSGRGLIGTRNAEIAGPQSVSGANGGNANRYSACYYSAPTTGIYGVVFSSGTNSTNNDTIDPPQTLRDAVSAWDVTVRGSDTTSLADLNGRVFTYAWTVDSGGNNTTTTTTSRTRRIATQLYYVSTDGYRYKQEFHGVDPYRAAFYANSSGFLDTNGAPLYHDFRGGSQQVTGGASATAGITVQAPQYPIFFSDISPTGANKDEVNRVLTALSIPSAPLPPVLANPAFVGNISGHTSTESAGGTFTFDTVNTLTYEIVIKRGATGAGDTPPNCLDNYDPANVCNRVLTGTALTGSHSVLWDGADNNGNAFPAGNYPFQIVGRNGEIHFPMADIEANVNGGPTLTKLNGTHVGDATVYFDDRGYKTANGSIIGQLNGRLCGATSTAVQPAPDTYSLVGADSSAFTGSGNGALYYRYWNSSNPGSNNANPGTDCVQAAQFFGDAKGLDIWGLEKSDSYNLPIEIVPPASAVDVGTAVTATPAVLAGDSAYGTFVFTNAGSSTANGVTYSVALGDYPGAPATCPATVNFTAVPAGVTATYHNATDANTALRCTITFTGMPATLTAGQTLTFNFNYVVATTNPGPIPITTAISATNETCNPVVDNCAQNTASAQTVVAKPVVSVTKSADPADGSQVAIGDTIIYTLSVTVQNAPLTAVFNLVDTLGTGLTFGAVQSSSPAFACSGSLSCSLPIGTAIGTYTVTYAATVNASASGSVANSVVPSGGGGDNPPTCGPCGVSHDVPPPAVPKLAVIKNGPATATVGVAFDYTITVTNTGTAPTTANTTITDTVPSGLTINSVTTPACSVVGNAVTCTLISPLSNVAPNNTATFTINVTPTPAAAGTTVTNTAYASGGGDPDCQAAADCASPPVDTTIDSPAHVTLHKSGPATAMAGDSIQYTLMLQNSGSMATGTNLVVKDQLPAGMAATAVTDANCGTLPSAAGAMLTCTVPGPVPANGSVSFQVTATAPSAAGDTITNYAATNPGGSGSPPSDPSASCDTATTSCASATTTVTQNFCPADGSVFNIVNAANFYAFTTPTFANTALASLQYPLPGASVNALMVDPVAAVPGTTAANRLLFHRRGGTGGTNGAVWAYDPTNPVSPGWYETSAVINVDLPRAGMTAAGVGYLMTSVSGPTNAPVATMYRITKNGAYDYQVDPTSITVSYDADPTDRGSGDLAFDAEGNGWLVAGNDLYKIVITSPTTATATRQQAFTGGPPSGTAYAGAAFGADGRLYVVVNATGAVWAMDLTAGTMTNVGTTGSGGGDNGRDLASCAFPSFTPPVLQVEKTLATVNGSAAVAGQTVQPGDVLGYAIKVSHVGGTQAATLYPGDVVETLPTGTTVVAAGNDFTCTGSNCPNTGTVNLAPGASVTLNFLVKVDDPLAAGVTSVVNAVTVRGVDCTDASNDCGESTTVRSLSIVKTVTSTGPYALNDIITYSLVATNTGGVTLTNVSIGDANATLGACTPAQPTTLAPGATLTCAATHAVTQADVNVGHVLNSATAVGTPPSGPPLTSPPSEVDTPVTQTPSLEIVKTVTSTGPYALNDTITYSLVATNNGTVTLTGVSISDANATLGTCTPAQPATLAPGATLTCVATHVVTSADVTAGHVFNSATANGTPPSGPPLTPPSNETDTPIVQPALAITKTSNGPWTVGQSGAAYTLTVTNTSVAATSGTIIVRDTLPAGISAPGNFTSGTWACTTVVQAINCASPAPIAGGGSSAISIPVSVDAAAVPSVTNNASVGGGGDPNNGGNPPTPGTCAGDTHCASTTTPVDPAADIAVTKSVDDATPNVGDTVTFTITATNNGPNNATGVQVTDSLPVGLTFVAALTSQGSFVQASGLWNIGALAVGDSVTLTITATVTQPGAITNTATVTASDQFDPDTSNNSASATLNPPASGMADIQVHKTVDNAAPSVGSNITYTIVVKNAGPDDATGVEVTDPLPAGLTFVSATPSQGTYSPATGVWTIGAINNSDSVTLTIVATVDQPGPIANTATKTGEDQADPDTSNDSSGVVVNGPSADIQVVKSVNDTAPDIGDTVTFTVTVRNNGPDDATGVEITDALPPGLTLSAWSTLPGSFDPVTGVWTIGTLAKNATATLTMTATVATSGSFTNTATKTGEDQLDPNPDNDSSSVDLGAIPQADLSITKTDGATTAVPGDTLVYTIVVHNAGPDDAVNATVADTLPATLTSASWSCNATAGSSCTASGNGNINDTVTVLSGGTLTYTLTATVDPTATGSVTNTATVTPPPGTIDPDPNNNSATDTDTLTPKADLSVTKDDGATTVAPGVTVTYTIVVTNNGPSAVTGATVADTLPAALTGATWTCAGAGGGTCGAASGSGNISDIVNLPVNATVTYTVTATLDANATGTLSNTATVTPPAGVDDPDPNNNTSTDTDAIVFPSLTVTKTSNGPWTVGQSGAIYTLTVTNAGTATTSGTITVLDTLPTGITAPATFTSTPWNCTTADQDVTCTSNAVIANTPPANTSAITIPVTVGVAAVGTLTNNASVGGGGDPNNNGNPPTPGSCATNDLHCGSTTTDITPPTVTVTKSSNPTSSTPVAAGQTITYTLTAVVADAPLSADLVLTDTLTGQQTFGAVTPGSQYAADTSTNPVLKFTLPAGTPPGTYAVSYTATVNANATGSVGNGVVPSGGGPLDPTCTDCTTVHPLKPTVTVSKSSNPASGSSVAAGDTITYTVQVVVANAPLANLLTLTDTLSANQTLGTVTNGSFSCGTGNPLVCTLPVGTPIGTYTLSYQATVNANASGSVGNAVVPSGGDGPTCPVSCSTSHPLQDPVVTVAKSSDPATGQTVTAGQTITYTLTATVTQAALTAPLVLTDTLSANQTFGAVTIPGAFTPGGSGNNRTFTLPAGTVPGTYAVSYTATVNGDASGSVGNQVTATGGGPTDPTCTACTTTHAVSPKVTVAKTANPADGTAVAAGQTITYTLTATVANGPTTDSVVLHDTLGTGLTLGAAPAGCAAVGQTMTCTLASGAANGAHTFTYTATVNADATVSVHNGVAIDPTHGGGDPNPGCASCTTTHPVSPKVTVAKTANPASGTAVAPNGTIQYTLTVTVANGPTTDSVVLTDTLGSGLTLGAAPAGCIAVGQTMTCTLASGATTGDHTFVYSATVTANATGSVGNSVVVDPTHNGGDPNPPGCATATPCTTTHPLQASVTIAKALTSETGSVAGVAEPGENLTYTITLTNTGGVDATGYALSDAVPANTIFVSASDGGTQSGGNVNWTGLTVPKQNGAVAGTKTVTVTFAVATPIPAGVTQIANVAYHTGDAPPTCPGADPACVSTPTAGAVTIAKALTTESGSVAGVAEPGESLTYTITLTNAGGTAVTGYALSDAIPANTIYVGSSDGGAQSGGNVNWTGLTVPAQIGGTAGTKTVTVTFQVVDPIPAGVTSIANIAYATGTTPSACPGNDPACVVTPTASNLSVTKALSGESIDTDGIAEPGEELTYTITVRNEGGAATTATIVNETVPAHTTFVSGAPAWTCAAGAPAGTACNALVDVPASTGANPGLATLTFTVKVDDPLPDNVTSILNAVAINDGMPPDCAALPTAPGCAVVPTANLRMTKTVASVVATGVARYQVNYRIDVVNIGGSATTYTLTDTLGFPNGGIVFTGNAQVATTGGTVNPALPGGQFVPMNGTIEQISASNVNLAVGATHTYTVSVPVGVQPGSLVAGACTGAAGHGFYNEASLAGTLDLDSAACAPIDGDVPLIHLIKTVTLAQDANGNHYGDVGDVLGYRFEIGNPGTLPLATVQLFDPRLESLTCDPLTANGVSFRVIPGDELFYGPFNVPPDGTLDPGDSVVCTGSYTLTADDVARRRVVNSATATGSAPGGQAVSSVSTAIFTQFR